jgi:hypothetical protein
MMRLYASCHFLNIVKRGFAWNRASGSQLAVSATALTLGSSQNDLGLFVNARKAICPLFKWMNGVLCRGVSIDNESDQAT